MEREIDLSRKKVILAIDPGSPKKKDISATTGWVVGDYFEPIVYDAGSIVINSKDRDIEDKACVMKLRSIVNEWESKGYKVDVVIEEYLNYSVQGFGVRNATSELIGMIRNEIGGVMQSTSAIKTTYSNIALEKLGFIFKSGRSWRIKGLDNLEITRHSLDALRHYLLRRQNLGMWNDLKGIDDLI